MMVIPTWAIIPYWIIVLLAIIDIITILLDSSTKEENKKPSGTQTIEDVKRRDKISIIPRLYFIVIYSIFFLYDTTLDNRAFWGRWGIFSILFIDSYLHLANYVDYHWYTILKLFNTWKKHIEK